jgi:hypothetical protein
LHVLSNCFEKQKSEQSRSEDVRRTSSEIDKKPSLALRSREGRQDPQHLKNTYVPAIHFSRNHFVSRQTRASAHKAPSPPDSVETLDGLLILQQQLFERIYEYILRDAELFSFT